MTLGMRLRTDLLWSPYVADRGDMWVAQDPVHREFFYFNALEKAIAVSLDGRRTIEGIVQNLGRHYLGRVFGAVVCVDGELRAMR